MCFVKVMFVCPALLALVVIRNPNKAVGVTRPKSVVGIDSGIVHVLC
jgi:hypothetical protein